MSTTRVPNERHLATLPFNWALIRYSPWPYAAWCLFNILFTVAPVGLGLIEVDLRHDLRRGTRQPGALEPGRALSGGRAGASGGLVWLCLGRCHLPLHNWRTGAAQPAGRAAAPPWRAGSARRARRGRQPLPRRCGRGRRLPALVPACDRLCAGVRICVRHHGADQPADHAGDLPAADGRNRGDAIAWGTCSTTSTPVGWHPML